MNTSDSAGSHKTAGREHNNLTLKAVGICAGERRRPAPGDRPGTAGTGVAGHLPAAPGPPRGRRTDHRPPAGEERFSRPG